MGKPFSFLQRDWRWFPALAFLYLLACVSLGPLPFYEGKLNSDPDDYLRAVQVRNLIEGADWFDTRELRLDPPNGTEVFSRLVDLPLAAVAVPLASVMPVNDAIIAASFVVPFLIMLPLLFLIGHWAYTPLVGRDWAWLSAPLFVVAVNLISEFMPGRIDHHGWQILLTLAALGFALRLLQAERAKVGPGMGLAAIVATSFAVGVEALPQMLCLLGFVGCRLWMRPQAVHRACLALGIALPLFTLLYMLALRSPDRWAEVTLLAPSWLWVKMTFSIGAIFSCGAFATGKVGNLYGRGFILLALIAAISGLLLWDTPDLLVKNAFIGLDEWFASLMRDRVIEQRPYIERSLVWPGLCIAGLFSCVGYLIAAGGGEDRALLYRAMTAMMVLALLATLFYAARFVRFWSVAAIPGLILCLRYALKDGVRYGVTWLQKGNRNLRRVVAFVALLAMCGGLAMRWSQSFPAGDKATAYPATGATMESCNLKVISDYLNSAYPATQTILAGNIIGPQLVFTTMHRVIGGGIYNNSEGMRLARDFFESDDPDAAMRLLRERGIDLIYICDNRDRRAGRALMFVTPDGPDRPETRMAYRLSRDELPAGLEKITVPGEERGALFRVVK